MTMMMTEPNQRSPRNPKNPKRNPRRNPRIKTNQTKVAKLWRIATRKRAGPAQKT